MFASQWPQRAIASPASAVASAAATSPRRRAASRSASPARVPNAVIERPKSRTSNPCAARGQLFAFARLRLAARAASRRLPRSPAHHAHEQVLERLALAHERAQRARRGDAPAVEDRDVVAGALDLGELVRAH